MTVEIHVSRLVNLQAPCCFHHRFQKGILPRHARSITKAATVAISIKPLCLPVCCGLLDPWQKLAEIEVRMININVW